MTPDVDVTVGPLRVSGVIGVKGGGGGGEGEGEGSGLPASRERRRNCRTHIRNGGRTIRRIRLTSDSNSRIGRWVEAHGATSEAILPVEVEEELLERMPMDIQEMV